MDGLPSVVSVKNTCARVLQQVGAGPSQDGTWVGRGEEGRRGGRQELRLLGGCLADRVSDPRHLTVRLVTPCALLRVVHSSLNVETL